MTRYSRTAGRFRDHPVALLAPILLLVSLLATPAMASTRSASSRRVSDTAWFTYSRPAKYAAVYSFVEVPMRDGAKLACDLQQPALGTPGTLAPPGTKPAKGRFPGVIDNYTPYDAVDFVSATSANPFATLGYDVLDCDQRGLDRSMVTAPGWTWTQPYAAIQTQDNYDMIEWLAHQPYSDGLIGQYGGSAGAQTSTLVATLRPPNLRAIVALTTASNMYSDSRYKGGVFEAWGPAWAGIAGALSAGGANPALITAQYLRHSLDDAYWQQQSPSSNYKAITIPDLQLEGWQDTDFPTGGLQIFAGTKANINPRNPQNTGPWALQGPWGHAGSPTCSPSPACGVVLAFFDHFLGGDRFAPRPPARVEVYQQSGPSAGTWQLYQTWPPSGAQELGLHLDAGGQLSSGLSRAGSSTYTVRRTDVATAGTPAERANQFLTFTSPPLAGSLVVAGDPILKLLAALTAKDGIFAVQLQDVAPSGSVSDVNVVPWLLKASHRKSNYYLTPVLPGRMTPYDVSGWPLDYRFQKGHRIRVKIASAPDEYPAQTSPAPNTILELPPPGDVTIATGRGGSVLVLPVLQGR